ncbi:MAG TPA: SIMPL domain-containing protein [Gaiellaceae bacterium]|nr:SIMPL domain-containing protein [Gaiellaceae bacterium]
MRRSSRILFLAALLLGAAALAGVAQPQRGNTAIPLPVTLRTITVNGNGAVTAVPDRATFRFGVETHAGTATAALAANAKDAAAVIAALEAAGAATADIQTSQVSLSTVTGKDGTTITGYTASNDVTVATPIGKAGALVDAAVGAGANGVSGPSLSVSAQDARYRDALGKAVADAQAKAQALAGAAGLHLGAVQSIVEGGGATPVPFGVKAAPSSGSVPIEPGTQKIDATVTVVYAVS